MDYVEYANLGSYLFNTVRARFASQGYLDAFDFFSIVIWKANRSKSKIAKRITNNGEFPLEDIVKYITGKVAQAAAPKEKLRILWNCNFRIPMASAILTVLYPEEFTVYDYRVCDVLGIPKILDTFKDFEMVWAGYQDYKTQVISSTPSELSLREKDLYLWGKSRADQLIEAIRNGVPPHNKHSDDDEASNDE
jgi:hypothetical protein